MTPTLSPYSVLCRTKVLLLFLVLFAPVDSSCSAEKPTIARTWNEEILAAIRIDKPNPAVHARNLFHLAVVMYDCWAAYDPTAVGYIHHERLPLTGDVEGARREAISYAAYRLLRNRYSTSANAGSSLKSFADRMKALGYDTNLVLTTGITPAALGNRIAATIIEWGLADGSNQAGGYNDPSYVNPQTPMIVLLDDVPGGYGVPWETDPNRWQPLALGASARFQNGLVAEKIQTYVGVTWLHTLAFGLTRFDKARPWIDPGPPARLGSRTDAEYKEGAMSVLQAGADLGSTNLLDKSPGKIGNNDLGSDGGPGHDRNPVTGQPYPSNRVKLGDFTRVLAEFWADGPNSETPPGHWHVLANEVADHPLTVKRIAGEGPLVSDLEWDVKTYFALGSAVHDAACAAWSLKRYYEGVRPITAIRYMATLGQSSDPSLPHYHPNGLPLKPGLVELITEESNGPGGRHEGVGWVGELAVFAWPGEPADRATQTSPVKWIMGMNWLPYQRKNFNTPAFPGYISGHSTFSRAAAVILSSITASPFFPGGFGSFTAKSNSYLVFERGPSEQTQIQWATYFDAADLAGQSRRWGGIHVPQDDYAGRRVGQDCGQQAWSLARRYWDGSILKNQIYLYLSYKAPGNNSVSIYSERGLYYRLEGSSDLVHWIPVSPRVRATEQNTILEDLSAASSIRFYRVACEASNPQQ